MAINLAFSCSLRMGELLGLTWDCVDISPVSIEQGRASIFIEKELQRVNRNAMENLNGKDILFKFPPTFASTHTALVLKTPKTKTSVRKVFLPKTVAEMLAIRKEEIEELDAERQKQLRLVADLTANSVSASQIDSITGYLDDWESVSFDDKRKVVDILISQIDATSESVTIHWKI